MAHNSHHYNEEQFQLILAHGPHSTVREMVRMGLSRAANREGVDLYVHTPDGECVRALALVDRGDKQFAALVGDGELPTRLVRVDADATVAIDAEGPKRRFAVEYARYGLWGILATIYPYGSADGFFQDINVYGDLDSHFDDTTIRVEINAASFRGDPAKALAWADAAGFAARIGLQLQALLDTAKTERQAWLDSLKQQAQ
jgi:hypothetical protein